MAKKWKLKDSSGKTLTITIAEKGLGTEQYPAEKSEASASLTDAPTESQEEIILESSSHILTITIAE